MKIPIVNEQDEIIGYKDRKDRNTVDITRITGLWLWNEKGETLLAQRAFSKSINPGLWGPAAAGTVEEGETYESNIIKEAEEEIGLKNLKPILGPKLRRTTKHAYFAQWFSATIDSSYPLVKQDSEVESLKWVSKDEFFKIFEDNPEMFIPSLKDSAIYFFEHANKS
ncbi:MAG: NUDIX domain-containing protein [Candidatus Pacebacteria bacterium]|nr:NUDIX domain-containing protein [Candidatus Paceibacterota bacterium]